MWYLQVFNVVEALITQLQMQFQNQHWVWFHEYIMNRACCYCDKIVKITDKLQWHIKTCCVCLRICWRTILCYCFSENEVFAQLSNLNYFCSESVISNLESFDENEIVLQSNNEKTTSIILKNSISHDLKILSTTLSIHEKIYKQITKYLADCSVTESQMSLNQNKFILKNSKNMYYFF